MKGISKPSLKSSAVKLRQQGKTYAEICSILKTKIPKATLSNWCKDIVLTRNHKERITKQVQANLKKQRVVALETNRKKRKQYLDSIYQRVGYLGTVSKDKDVSKIMLAVLYWCEGSKGNRGSLTFGNSNPDIIKLFLTLLRQNYKIDEKKFRCTLQGRADQPIKRLERYWSEITDIPLSQFYQARIDPRSIGKVSRKPDYKGVCRIDYFSADIYNELLILEDIFSA